MTKNLLVWNGRVTEPVLARVARVAEANIRQQPLQPAREAPRVPAEDAQQCGDQDEPGDHRVRRYRAEADAHLAAA